jgi:hypothetical protein
VNYEFVDTEMGGELLKFDENDEDEKKMESEFALCSRTFRSRRGEFRSPRNVFLHGRGGAKNLSCLYRFEANVGEQVCIKSIFPLFLLKQKEGRKKDTDCFNNVTLACKKERRKKAHD